MVAGGLHLLKLCVGADTVADLADWQAERSAVQARSGLDPRPVHVTRMWPRRAGELLDGGSLYWVIRGVLCLRQRIAALEPVEEDGVRRCAIVLDPMLVRTHPRPCRPFQGWRYLTAGDAPADLDGGGEDGRGDLPPHLRLALAELGLRELG